MLHVADAPPFPAQGEAGTSAAEGTSEALLQKSDLHRFGASGAYRDVPFAILFGTHLLGVVVIAAANGSSVWSISSGSVAPRSDAGARYHQLIAILAVIIVAAACASLAWLWLLRSGSRALVWLGAGGAAGIALVAAIWLLAQATAASVVLGLGCLLLSLGAAAFLALNRSRVAFSIHLLATTAELIRAFPMTLYVAFAASALQLAWLLLWASAFSYTAQLSNEAGAYILLILSFFWTSQLIKAVVHTTVAGTVASWYFLSPHVPPDPTSRALKRALTTSFGSLCLGSLVAGTLQTSRATARSASRRGSGLARSCCLCCLGFLDVLVRFFNEFAYTQVAMYGKTFTRASRDTWTLLVHHSGVEALIQRDLVAGALAFGALTSGVLTALIVAAWSRAAFGDGSLWWQSAIAAFAIGYGSVALTSSVVEAGVCALYVCYAEDPSPLSAINPELYALFISAPQGTPDAERGCCAGTSGAGGGGVSGGGGGGAHAPKEMVACVADFPPPPSREMPGAR